MQNSSHKISEGDIFCSAIAKSSDHATTPSADPDADAEIEAEFEEFTAAARRDTEQKQHTKHEIKCAKDRERQVQVRAEGEAAAAQRRKREAKEESSARELVKISLQTSRAARKRSSFERLKAQLQLALHTRSAAHVELALATELELNGGEVLHVSSAAEDLNLYGQQYQLLGHADRSGFTPLHTLFMDQNDDAIRVLMPHDGASVPPPAPLKKSHQDTARHTSCCDQTEVVAMRFLKLLMRWGADPKATVQAPSLLKGSTALHLAARRGWISMLELLLRGSEHVDGGAGCAGVVDLRNSDSAGCYTALMYTCLPHKICAEQKLHSDVSGSESDPIPPVASNSTVKSLLAAASVLLRYGASRLATDKHGRTALHLAAAAGLDEHVKVILQGHTRARDDLPSSGQADEVARLLAARDHDAQTAYDLARSNGHMRIADALMQAFLLG
eukprot:g1979.t1